MLVDGESLTRPSFDWSVVPQNTNQSPQATVRHAQPLSLLTAPCLWEHICACVAEMLHGTDDFRLVDAAL